MPDLREAGIGVRLGTEGVIHVPDPPLEPPGPDTAVDENRLEELIIEAQTTLPVEMPGLANRCASALGLGTALIYLVDLQQQLLIPLDEATETLPVEHSLAGWAYRTLSPRVADTDDGVIVWLPLVDGAERLGVLAVQTAWLDGVRLRRSRMLAYLLAMLITSKRAYSDWLAARTRTATMGCRPRCCGRSCHPTPSAAAGASRPRSWNRRTTSPVTPSTTRSSRTSCTP